MLLIQSLEREVMLKHLAIASLVVGLPPSQFRYTIWVGARGVKVKDKRKTGVPRYCDTQSMPCMPRARVACSATTPAHVAQLPLDETDRNSFSQWQTQCVLQTPLESILSPNEYPVKYLLARLANHLQSPISRFPHLAYLEMRYGSAVKRGGSDGAGSTGGAGRRSLTDPFWIPSTSPGPPSWT
jgi:hypothetical protein